MLPLDTLNHKAKAINKGLVVRNSSMGVYILWYKDNKMYEGDFTMLFCFLDGLGTKLD